MPGVKTRGCRPTRDEESEGQERQHRRGAEAHRRQADEEDEDAGEGREPCLHQHRRDDERPLVNPDAPQCGDARRWNPDRPRHVLRKHRGHFCLQRKEIGDAQAPGSQDSLPANGEEEVVDGEDRGRDGDVREVGVAQEGLRLLPGSAEGPAEEEEEHAKRGQLDRDERPAATHDPLVCPAQLAARAQVSRNRHSHACRLLLR